MIDAEHLEQAEKFRKIYKISEHDELYRKGKIFATCAMRPTDHEQAIADKIVRAGLFEWYAVFLDCFFVTRYKNVKQVDVIAVGKSGIFVLESKDYNGWIFGSGRNEKWTEVRYKKKFQFYNPILQNESHIETVRDVAGEKANYYSVVVFGNEATLKKVEQVSDDTYVVADDKLLPTLETIIETKPECLTEEEVLEICRKINLARLPRSNKMVEEHIRKAAAQKARYIL